MNSADDYETWRREAYQQLIDLNEKANATFGVTAWDSFSYDLDRRELVFIHNGRPRIRAEIQLVGAVEGVWHWGWSNPARWPAAVLEDANTVRAFGERFGIPELTNPNLSSPDLDQLGWTMAAVAARLTGAVGAYRPKAGSSALYLIYRSITPLD